MLQCVSVLSDRTAGTLSSYLYQREIQPGEPVSLERSDHETKMGCLSTIPQAVMKNRPTRKPHARCWRDSIFRTRGEFSPQKSFSPRKKYPHEKQLIFLYFPCYGTMGSLSPFVFFYAFVDIAIRLFATDLSFTNTLFRDRS